MQGKIRKDYHIHTELCRHATGSVRAYIESAIKKGFTEICFTDHMPLENNFDPEHRMTLSEADLYFNLLEKYKKEYTEITIKAGIEADFIDGMEKFTEVFLNAYPLDYVLMAVHFIKQWPENEWVFDFPYKKNNIGKYYKDYFNALNRGIKTGLYDSVAHIDLIKRKKLIPAEIVPEAISHTLDLITEQKMAVEINTSGFDRDIEQSYPSHDIIRELSERKVPVLTGSDAHKPASIGRYFDRISDFYKANNIPLNTVSFTKRKIASV